MMTIETLAPGDIDSAIKLYRARVLDGAWLRADDVALRARIDDRRHVELDALLAIVRTEPAVAAALRRLPPSAGIPSVRRRRGRR